MFPQRRIPVRLSAAHLDQACRLPDVTTRWGEGSPDGGKWEGLLVLPRAPPPPPRPVLHELASSLPSGHGLIAATGVYWRLKREKKQHESPVCVTW